MGIEIERKFLVKQELWKKIAPQSSKLLRQAYLTDEPDKTIRVRTNGEEGFLTIKGRARGISRQEFEYTIPLEEANQLIDGFATTVVQKIRHYVKHAGKLWEVDEFLDLNQGLWVAEVELTTENEPFDLPPWAGQEVTEDVRYLNARLAKNPYTKW